MQACSPRAERDDNRLVRIDPRARTIGERIRVDGVLLRVAGGGSSAWVVVAPTRRELGPRGTRFLYKVDEARNRLVPSGIRLRCDPSLAVDGPRLWVANRCSRTVTLFNEGTGERVETPIRLPGPVAIALAGRSVWVANQVGLRRMLTRIDRERFRNVASTRLSGFPVAVAARGSDAWVAAIDGSIVRVNSRTNRVVGFGRIYR